MAHFLKSKHFNVSFSNSTGSIQNISNPLDESGTNFVLNGDSAPKFDVPDSRWLGDLIFHVRRASETHGCLGRHAKSTKPVSGADAGMQGCLHSQLS